jgi:hypothetical protein
MLELERRRENIERERLGGEPLVVVAGGGVVVAGGAGSVRLPKRGILAIATGMTRRRT